mgnify:CR=1 FL=1
MNVTYWVTNQCNLKCKYCYVEKDVKFMTLKIAEDAYNFVSNFIKKSIENNEKINISFHGGEPLLNFEVIKYLVEKHKSEKYNNINFMMTTNGTLFSKEIFDYVTENIQISLSLDGKKEINDLNRIFKDGTGSFDKLKETLQYLKNTNKFFRTRMTITKKTLKELADNYLYICNLDLNTIPTFAVNISDDWDREDIDIYYEQLDKLMQSLIKRNEEECKYLLYNIKEATFRKRGYCDGGETTLHINSNGDLYPCIMSVNNSEFYIGNIYEGIDKNILKKLQDINKIENNKCCECTFKSNCANNCCKIINKVCTGDFYVPSAFSCNEINVIYKIYKKYKYLLENFNV